MSFKCKKYTEALSELRDETWEIFYSASKSCVLTAGGSSAQ